MPADVTADNVVEAAQGLDQDEFTRGDIAAKLGVEQPEIKKGFRKARRAGLLEKTRNDDEGTGHFRLTESAEAPSD